jgi:hypothetical protein
LRRRDAPNGIYFFWKTNPGYQDAIPSIQSVNGMFDLTCHKWFGVQQKDSEASLCTKINALTAIVCTWKFGWILDSSAAHSFELGF